jgi:hypothetical protein
MRQRFAFYYIRGPPQSKRPFARGFPCEWPSLIISVAAMLGQGHLGVKSDPRCPCYSVAGGPDPAGQYGARCQALAEKERGCRFYDFSVWTEPGGPLLEKREKWGAPFVFSANS